MRQDAITRRRGPWLRSLWLAAGVTAALAACGGGDDSPTDDAASDDAAAADSADVAGANPQLETLGRCRSFDPLRVPLFGDTHVHTVASLDANLQGTRLTAADAYRFARGEAVGIQPHAADGTPQRQVQIDRPLDFVALTDHAEFLGTTHMCTTEGSEAYESDRCVQFREEPDRAFIVLNFRLAAEPGTTRFPDVCGDDGAACVDGAMSVWRGIQADAEAAYDRSDACAFTSFVAYEWSSSPGTENLHRNVIFRNHVVPDFPTSYFEEDTAEGLWESLQSHCLDAPGGCDVLAIPHNSNLSNGRMFAETDADGEPFSTAYRALRAAMEPLAEIYQHKGDSECRPGDPTSDEHCAFEKLPYNNLSQPVIGGRGAAQPGDFLRHALARGLAYVGDGGANPFQMGFVASTDTHLATPGLVDEGAFPGHGGAGSSNRVHTEGLVDDIEFSPGGLSVVWAEENSREAIFEAMRRRETYGTSGPRITLRFFGGWGYQGSLCDATGEDFARTGYDDGVPMGGTLPGRGEATAPTFAVSALRDAGVDGEPGVPLQRVQIVKGWLDDAGEPRSQTYDVAGPVDPAASVDLASCARSGDGADALCDVWTDPDFDPAVAAFYYARVLENPSCRWSTRDCVEAGIDCEKPESVIAGYEPCCAERDDGAVQERAWSSPIWYTPAP